MSQYLLDTHVLVWLAASPEQVPQHVKDELSIAHELYVSAATTYEIAEKFRLGRMPQGEGILARWDELLRVMIAKDLPLSTKDMMQAGTVQWEHRDPFDRMIVAQAQLRGLTIVTKDSAIRAFSGVNCVTWDLPPQLSET